QPTVVVVRAKNSGRNVCVLGDSFSVEIEPHGPKHRTEMRVIGNLHLALVRNGSAHPRRSIATALATLIRTTKDLHDSGLLHASSHRVEVAVARGVVVKQIPSVRGTRS